MSSRRRDIMGVSDVTGKNLEHGAVTLSNVTATKIPEAGSQVNRKAIAIFNYDSSITIFVGNSGVTAANGYPILPYASIPLDISDGADIYAIAASGTPELRFFELDNG